MGDESYKAETEKRELPRAETEADRQALESFHGARHLDCAPGHIQEAVARSKRGDHMKVPQ